MSGCTPSVCPAGSLVVGTVVLSDGGGRVRAQWDDAGVMSLGLPADESAPPPADAQTTGSVSFYWVAGQGLYARVRHADGTVTEKLL